MLFRSALSTLRTKPGRIDSPPTTSHSCSDKIALWGSVGVQGALLGSLVGRVELGILVVGGVAREEWERLGEEVHRAVAGRLGRTMGVAFTEMEFEGSKKGSEASCPESELRRGLREDEGLMRECRHLVHRWRGGRDSHQWLAPGSFAQTEVWGGAGTESEVR